MSGIFDPSGVFDPAEVARRKAILDAERLKKWRSGDVHGLSEPELDRILDGADCRRTRDSLAAAKARGVRLGRPPGGKAGQGRRGETARGDAEG